MKKLNLTALTAAVLMSSTFLASGSAMAFSTTTNAHVAAGSSCRAYNPAQDTNLTISWNSITSKSDTWVHCSGMGGAGMLAAEVNLTIPTDATRDIYNCYLTTRKAASGAETETKWAVGSSAGVTNRKIGPATAALGYVPVAATGDTVSVGCYLYGKQSLHSVARVP